MKLNANTPAAPRQNERAFILLLELVAGMFILLAVIMPVAYSFFVEARMFRAEYRRGVAMEIVDGEMEVLAAGEWKAFPDGSQVYTAHALAATNLPAGHFQFTKTGNHLRLEWQPDHQHGGLIAREVVAR